MKMMKQYPILACLAIFLVQTACTNYDADDHKFGNVVYFDIAETTDVQTTTIKNTLDELDKTFSATLAYPSEQDVTVSVSVDPGLVARYNARFGTSWSMLDEKYYALSTESITIPAGKTTSETVSLHLQELLGEGEEQAGALPLDETYLLPVTISQASIPVLGSSSTIYYLVKRSSNITTAAQLTNNWINFPTLDTYSDQSMAFNNLTAVTYEALIYIDEFATSTVTSDGNTNAVNISSVMGVESYLLLRIGDTNFERQQLQFDGSGSGSSFGKFPERDASKILSAGQWYHVAATYDQATRKVCIYVNGELQSEGKDMGISSMNEDTRINLAMRALYDFYLKNPTDENEQKYGGWADARQFFISYSYDDYRPLNGKICEARVWSVARTQEQIWENMYEIADPESDPTLLGYWKFNEGSGNTIKDYSQYHNDGEAAKDIVWPDGLEIPKIHETEE